MIEHYATLLAESELFGDLPPVDRQRIVQLCTRKRFAAKQVIFHQGEPGREMFIVVSGRLAGKLLELGEENGTEKDGGVQIDLKLSQYELGTLINASRESVNKQLKTWENQGIIKISHGKIFLIDLPVLEALA